MENNQEQPKTINGYKAFDKDMKCRGFQFKVGKSFKWNGETEMCENGFHFCQNPLNVLDFYDMTESKFAEVEGRKVSTDSDGKKSCAGEIEIKAELKLSDFIKASVEYVKNEAGIGSAATSSSDNSAQLAASGDYAKLAASGYSAKLAASGDYAKLAASGGYAKLAASGDYAQLAASGYSAKLDSTGKDAVVAGIGVGNRARAKKGSWIVLAEYKWNDAGTRRVPVCVKTAKVDGKEIKENTWYELVGGQFKEVA